MIITHLKVNRIINPIGFELGVPRFSYIIEESRGYYQQRARIQISLDEEFQQILLDTGMTEEIDSLSWSCPMELLPSTRYYWRVEAEADNGERAVSETAFFETAKKSTEFVGKFISCVNTEINCDFIKEFTIENKVSRVVANCQSYEHNHYKDCSIV